MDIYSYALLMKKIKEVGEQTGGGLVQVDTYSNLPSTGESYKIYCTQDTNKLYRWENEYIELAEGEGGGDAEGIKPITEAPTADNPDDDLKIVILPKAPETEYSGYLYLITDNLFEFKVTDYNYNENYPTYTFLAEKGMTWQQWVNSDYNCWYDDQGEIIPHFWEYSSNSGVHKTLGPGVTRYLVHGIFKIYSEPDIDKNTHVQDSVCYHSWVDMQL